MYKYAGRVLPEAERLLAESTVTLEAENAGGEQSADPSRKVRSSLDLRCCSLFALYPGLDAGNALSFTAAFHSLINYLDMLCRQSGANDETVFRSLYPALQDAVDPERTTGSYQLGYSLKNGREVKKLVDQCRLHITALPSYRLVTGKMKRYVQLYIDLQAFRYLCPDLRTEYIETWADFYLRRYRDITCWEFSAAAGSLLGVFSMFAAAGDPGLTPSDVKALDEAYFPWLCGLHKLLEAYISAREDVFSEQLNFTSYYNNLKVCAERLAFFIDGAYGRCAGIRNPEFHIFVISFILSLYLSDSRARFGMYGLASRSIIRGCPPVTDRYLKIFKLLRGISVL